MLRRFTVRITKSLSDYAIKKQFSTISSNYFHRNSTNHQKNAIQTQFVRNYAKGKDKKKEKGKAKIVVNDGQLMEHVSLESMRKQMERATEQLKLDFTKNLTVRSTTGSIESILVPFDDQEHTLQELAQISRKNPKTVIINMSLFPQAIPSVLKAIEKSGLNLNPQQDGTTLYIPIPKVTKEHREALTKNAKQFFVKCKDNIRDVQIKYAKQIKNKSSISQDDARNMEAQLVAIANEYIDRGEKMYERKCEELIGKD
ncbi:unnamed protein product [Phyllotreta striolata]|uniref:Ribosome-recycling factor, mitochondrial n=1 Tax=Phyllotreta striolata TaxID=444603 RepID=A0A9N9TJT6_PHYSR|nr:unnamed protein product [Phyllotreta striolata]